MGKEGKRELFVVVLFAIIIRFAIAFLTGAIYHPQVYEYEELANNILQGKGYVGSFNGTIYYSMMAPLYPYLIAIVYSITNHSQTAIIILQIVISSFSSILVVKIGSLLVKSPTPFIAGLMTAFNPALILYSSTKIHEISLVIFFILINIYLIASILNNFSYYKTIFISLAFVAAIFTRVTLIFFPFILLIFINGAIRKKFYVTLLLLIFCFSFVLVWNYRNYKIHGKFVFSTTAAFNLYMGNNIDATGTEFTGNGNSIRNIIMGKNEILLTMNEGQQYEYFKNRAIEFILENPFVFVLLTIKRIYYFWWFSPYTGLEYPKIYLFAYKILNIFILLSALIGVIDPFLYRTRPRKRLLFIVLFVLIIICFFQSLVYVHYRHRAAVEPVILLFSANGICRFFSKFKYSVG